MRLLANEIRRFWSRGLVWGLVAACIGLSLLGVVIGFTQSSSAAPTAASADQSLNAERDACARATLREMDLNGDDFEIPFPADLTEEERLQFVRDRMCDFSYDPSYNDKRFFATTILQDNFGGPIGDWSDYRERSSNALVILDSPTGESSSNRSQIRGVREGLNGIVPIMGVFFLVIASVAGASFMGAEYRFGTVENLLLWEPRRLRVIAAKYAGGALSVAAMAVIVFAILSALLFALSGLRGSTEGIDGTFYIDLASTIGRIAVTAGIFMIMAMAIATIARTTAAAVFVILGWFVFSNIAVALFLRPLARWELFNNARGFITEGDVGRYQKSAFGGYDQVYGHSYGMGIVVVAAWALVIGGTAAWVFHRRDLS